MSALPRERRHRLNADEYLRMGEASILAPDARTELIDGEIIHMPPIGSAHAGIVTDLDRRLNLACGDRALIWAQNPVVLTQHDTPQPDLCLLRPRADGYKRSLPEATDVWLVVEVSDTTLAYDRDYKAPMYAAAGIVQSWRVEVGAERIVVQTDPRDGRYTAEAVVQDIARVSVNALPGLVLDLSGLF